MTHLSLATHLASEYEEVILAYLIGIRAVFKYLVHFIYLTVEITYQTPFNSIIQ